MVTYNTNFLRAYNQKSFSFRNYEVLSNKTLNVALYKNAYILPYKETNDPNHIYAGVITENGEYLDESAFHEHIGKAYLFSPNDISSINSCIYLGVIDNCWGHVITDAIKKTWYINKFNIKDGIFVYTTRYNKPLANHTLEILSLAGIDTSRCIHIKTITKVKELILPDNSLYIENGQRFYTNEFKTTIFQIKQTVLNKYTHKNLPTYKSIYFTRTKLNDWRDHGEHAIESAFEKKGFKIIAPEQLSPSEQIYLLMNCEEFATMSGSPAHSAEFCSAGTTFIDIRKADYWNTYQEVANHLANLNVILIDAHKSSMVKPKAPWGGPFYIYKTKEFKRFFNKIPLVLPLLLRPTWLQYRYKEPLKDIYYRIRAKLGIKTNLTRINNFIKQYGIFKYKRYE